MDIIAAMVAMRNNMRQGLIDDYVTRCLDGVWHIYAYACHDALPTLAKDTGLTIELLTDPPRAGGWVRGRIQVDGVTIHGDYKLPTKKEEE